MMNKKGILLVIIGICLSVSVGIGFSYAVWNQTEKQEEANAYQTGCFAIEITNQENAINLSNQFPITDSEGKALVPFTFTVENTCDYYASYAINLEILEGSTMNDEYIKVMLDDIDPVRFDNTDLQSATTVETNSIESKTLATSGVGAGQSNNHSLRIWMDENASMDAARKTLNSKIVISAVATEKPLTGAEYLETLLADNSNTMVEDGTKDNNIRYIGTTPQNYVTFNGETWRIIGVFNNMYECPEDTEGKEITTDNYADNCKKTRLLKIIRNTSLDTYSWDSTDSNVNYGYGVNEWSTSAIQTALNEAYYNSTSGTCYGSSGKSNKACDFSQTGSMKGLDETARNQVARVMWNTGTVDGTTHTYSKTNTKDMYTAERSDNNGKSLCSSGTDCNDNVTRTTKWIGKVGLMYPSDYGYATSGGSSVNRETCLSYQLYNWNSGSYKTECAQNSWLLNSSQTQWTMTPVPRSSYASYVFVVHSSGYVNGNDDACNTRGVRPVVYLKSNVKIVYDDKHNGSKDKPYELEF